MLFRIGPSVSPDRIYPALTLTSGVAVVVVGASLLVTRTRRLQQRRATNADHHDEPGAGGGGAAGSDDDQDHEQDASRPAPHPVHTSDHGHHHQHTRDPTQSHDALHSPAAVVHSHAHGPHGHSHELPEGVAPLSRRGLAILATSGGILPSPSAVIVLVAAFTAGRATLGLALVGAFSLGLAATLTAVGLILVVGGRLAGTRLNTRVVPLLPLLGAAAITILGLIISAQGIRTLR